MITDAELFFVSESVQYAKSLPICDCNRFLSGMIFSLGEEHPVVPRLRRAVTGLMDTDQQLELIQVGQLKLDLETSGKTGAPTSRAIATKGASTKTQRRAR